MSKSKRTGEMSGLASIGLFVGPLAALLIVLVGPPAALEANATHDGWPAWVTLALLVLMATWWVTEAIPIPVTSLLPLIVLPLTGARSLADVAAPYMHPIVLLLLGGFVFAKAIERWSLHERIALHTVRLVGTRPPALVAGFMLAAAILSMWISNTATSIMMIPIALSVAAAVQTDSDHEQHDFTIALLLGIAFACSIGGLGTPIGTPTNLIVLGYLNERGSFDIGFVQWMMLGIPVVVIMVPLAWWVLTRWVFNVPTRASGNIAAVITRRMQQLGAVSTPEKRTIAVFIVVAILWVFRRPLNQMTWTLGGEEVTPLAGLSDPITAVIAVLLCFLIPAGKGHEGQKLLDWQSAEEIPWGVLLLFGGGMSLAGAISVTGLSTFLGQMLAGLSTLPLFLLLLIITASVLALTEVTSNIATASALMPVLGAVAMETGIPLEMLAAPVALAASCAFMLPMATGPNAVVFATNRVALPTMARAGFRLNVLALMVIACVAYWLVPALQWF